MFTRSIACSQKNRVFPKIVRQSTNGRTAVNTNPSVNQHLNVNGNGHKVNQTQKMTFGGGFLAGAASTLTLTAAGMYAIHSHCQQTPDSTLCKTLKEYICK